jgi:hypothetical protein
LSTASPRRIRVSQHDIERLVNAILGRIEAALCNPASGAVRAAKTPAAKVNARGSDKGCGIGVNRRREIITGEFRSA